MGAARQTYVRGHPRASRLYPSGSASGAILRDPGGRRATSSDVTAVSTITGLAVARPLWGESGRHFKRKCSDGPTAEVRSTLSATTNYMPNHGGALVRAARRSSCDRRALQVGPNGQRTRI